MLFTGTHYGSYSEITTAEEIAASNAGILGTYGHVPVPNGYDSSSFSTQPSSYGFAYGNGGWSGQSSVVQVEVIRNTAPASSWGSVFAPVNKSWNSFKEIGRDFTHAQASRWNALKEDPFNIRKGLNWLTYGASDGTYYGYKERNRKKMDSAFDFANWLSSGFAGSLKGALAPEEKYSKEHWLNSLSVVAFVVGGRQIVKPSTSGLKAGVRGYSDRSIPVKGTNNFAPELFKTESNAAFFWSGRTNRIGGAERALEIAKQKGGTTLEGLIESKGIKMPEWDINNPASIKAWEDVSAAYASQVSGEIRAVVGSNLRQGNIWEKVELPRLMNNPNVTKITTIDPKTLVEKVIFER